MAGCSSVSTVQKQHCLAHRHLQLDMEHSARAELSILLHIPVSYGHCFHVFKVFLLVLSHLMILTACEVSGSFRDKYSLYSIKEKTEA